MKRGHTYDGDKETKGGYIRELEERDAVLYYDPKHKRKNNATSCFSLLLLQSFLPCLK